MTVDCTTFMHYIIPLFIAYNLFVTTTKYEGLYKKSRDNDTNNNNGNDKR